MNATALEQKTHRVIDEYIQRLDHYTYEQLIQQPAPGSWSIGQVYIHLWMSAKGFFFRKADLCLTGGEGTVKAQSKNWKGILVFVMGRMPTVRVRMPDQVAVEPRQPESIEQAKAKLMEIRDIVTAYIRRLPQADLSITARHPFLGYLNAGEWVSLCHMHFRHHEAQLKRIEKEFGW
ncbi:MAG: DinB family protein [Bacteroidetes bacterium]|nr:DinB family protein [Bacteroidota bacterium]